MPATTKYERNLLMQFQHEEIENYTPSPLSLVDTTGIIGTGANLTRTFRMVLVKSPSLEHEELQSFARIPAPRTTKCEQLILQWQFFRFWLHQYYIKLQIGVQIRFAMGSKMPKLHRLKHSITKAHTLYYISYILYISFML